MSPGPNTIRKVSRLCAHLDFTTRPRTGSTSVSTPAAGSITNLLFIDTPPLLLACAYTTGVMAGGARTRPQADNTYLMEMSKGKELENSGNRSVGPQPFAFTTASSVEDAAVKATA